MVRLWLDSRAPRHDYTTCDHGEEIGVIGTPPASKAGGAGSSWQERWLISMSILTTTPNLLSLFDLPLIEAISERDHLADRFQRVVGHRLRF